MPGFQLSEVGRLSEQRFYNPAPHCAALRTEAAKTVAE